MTEIRISAEDIIVTAELNDSDTAETIKNALPIEGTVNTWGDEIYFTIPIDCAQEEDARAEVEVGELGYVMGDHGGVHWIPRKGNRNAGTQ